MRMSFARGRRKARGQNREGSAHPAVVRLQVKADLDAGCQRPIERPHCRTVRTWEDSLAALDVQVAHVPPP